MLFSNYTLNFSDAPITKTSNNHTSRKSTTTRIVMHYTSTHPTLHKQIHNIPFHDRQVTTTYSIYTEKPQQSLLCTAHVTILHNINTQRSIPWSASNNYAFSIYRKTTTVTVMHFKSNHHAQHKHTTFYSMISKEQPHIQYIQENHNRHCYALNI